MFSKLLRDPKWEVRFGSLYVNIKIENKYAYLHTFFFLVRRTLLAGSIVFAPDLPFLQVYLNIGISLFLLMYLIQCKPLMSRKSIYFEVYNELTVLMLSYLQIPLVELVTDT